MVYALYYNNKLQYKRVARDITDFKHAVYKKRGAIFEKAGFIDKYGHFCKLFNKKFNCIVCGWQIRKYKSYNDVLTLIKSEASKTKGRNKKAAANYFYVFDTESTNINNQYAVTYLYGIKKYNFSITMSDDNIKDFAEDYHAFYGASAIQDFSDYLFNINQEALKNDELIYIYVHNLIYDLFELIQNIFPRFTYTDEDYKNAVNDSIFRGSATKPLRYRFKNLVFIDSLALTNKSLKKISENHKIKKQEELKTYKEQYFFGSDLPADELIYNEYDLDVTALGVMDAIRSLKTDFKTFNEFTSSYVSTVTGISKYLNKHIYDDEEKNKALLNEHTARASNNLPLEENARKIDTERLLFRQDTFQGGFTHANPFVAYNTRQNDKYTFISYDKKSHYPSTMTMRFFPYKFSEIKENRTELLKQYDAENLQSLNFENYTEFKNNMTSNIMTVKFGKVYRSYLSPFKHYFICEITIKNLAIKFYGFNCMPLIAFSKTTLKSKDYLNKKIVVDNGKILKADRLTLRCTEADLLSYHMFYDFEIVTCTHLEHTINSKFADGYIQNTLRYHLVNKNEIDNCIKGKKDITELKDFTGAPLFSDTQINNYMASDLKEREKFLNTEYTATKTNGINNQYGINVQKIINDNINFNLKTYEFEKEINVIQGCQGTQTTRDYITGMYITAYARLDLALMSYIVMTESVAQIVYWDTDSIKIKCLKSDLKAIDGLFTWYNEKIQVIRENVEEYHGTLYNLGIWENDGRYKYFYTMGAKKYIVCKKDKKTRRLVIEVTNSGINKEQYSDFLTARYRELLKNHGYKKSFVLLCNNYYHPNLLIGSDISGRKTIKYPVIHDRLISETRRDENGEQININQFETALITECDYNLTSLQGNHLINRQHFQLCRFLQQSNNIKFECNTALSQIGKKAGLISDEFSDFTID